MNLPDGIYAHPIPQRVHIMSLIEDYGLEIAREDKMQSLVRATEWATFIALSKNEGPIPVEVESPVMHEVTQNIWKIQKRAVQLGWLVLIQGCACDQCEPPEIH